MQQLLEDFLVWVSDSVSSQLQKFYTLFLFVGFIIAIKRKNVKQSLVFSHYIRWLCLRHTRTAQTINWRKLFLWYLLWYIEFCHKKFQNNYDLDWRIRTHKNLIRFFKTAAIARGQLKLTQMKFFIIVKRIWITRKLILNQWTFNNIQ